MIEATTVNKKKKKKKKKKKYYSKDTILKSHSFGNNYSYQNQINIKKKKTFYYCSHYLY